jgi:hypothetical protein
MPAHKDSTHIHVPYAWTYADETEREAATGFAAGDVGKLARQLDNNSLWMLVDDSPVTWEPVGSASGVARSGSTVDGNLVVWNGSDADSIKDGGAPGRVLIAQATPSGTGTVTFSTIPGTYKALEILFTARSTKSGASNEEVTVELNADTTATNYRSTYIQAHTGSPATLGGEGRDVNAIAIITADSAPAGSPGAGRILVPLYAGSTFNKVLTSELAYRFDNSAVQLINVRYALEWENTAAITQIVLKLASGNFVAGSTFRLYGLN